MKKNNIIICLLILIFSCTHVLARSKVIIDRYKQCREGNLLICREVNRDSSKGRRCINNNEALACSEIGHSYLEMTPSRDPETRKKDQQEILYFLQKACNLRFFDACLTLAKEYEKGSIVKKNIEKTNDIYQNLCSIEKIGDGCFHQARLMVEEKIQGDLPHIKDFLTQACQFDFPLACFEIGSLLNKDSSLKDGEKQALEFWEKGCQEKDGKSCHALASFFETQQNFEKAHFLYQKSCFFENFKACAKFIHFHQKHPFPAFSLEIQKETYEGNEKYQRIDLSKERFAKDFHLELFLKTQEACFHGNSRGCADLSINDTTKETSISVQLNLDGSGVCEISTGLHFFDHMLNQIGRHSGVDLKIEVKGDLEVDEHHTIEDTALALGEAFRKAVGQKIGMERYGFCLPMDDCFALAAIDFGGRPWLVWDAAFNREKVGDMPTEMFMHFFKSFSDTALCNLNIKAEGTNEHHKIEAIFKAFAKAIKMAIKRDVFNFELPSTKGVL